MPDADSPEVTIIIPCFNRENLIAAAIDSALEQGPDVEVIVVDDGSTDGSFAVISRYSRIRSIQIPNAGPSAARNKGISLSHGRYLRFLDSDDLLPTGSTEALLKESRMLPSNMIAFGDAELIDLAGLPTAGIAYGYANSAAGAISATTLLSRPMPAVLPLLPRSAAIDAGGFDERLCIGEDHELSVRLALQGYTFFHVPTVTYMVREHPGKRLSRDYGQDGYRAQINAFETIWWRLERRPEPLTIEEREAIGRLAWSVGRGAARERFKPESKRLFSLARQMAGAGSINGSAAMQLAYRLMPPFQAERLAEAAKSVMGHVAAKSQ